MPRAQDDGDAQNFGARGLNWPIADRALVEFQDAGGAPPVKAGPHDAGVESESEPVVRPPPIPREQLVMLVEHLMRFVQGNAETPGQGFRLLSVLDRQQPDLVTVA